MSFGIIEYNDEGLPMCEVCGLCFKRVVRHVSLVHGMEAREYKKLYGFDLKRGICSAESSQKTRTETLENYDKCIKKNLLKKGKKYRYKKGDSGRTKEMVSEQTKIRLTTHNLPNPKK